MSGWGSFSQSGNRSAYYNDAKSNQKIPKFQKEALKQLYSTGFDQFNTLNNQMQGPDGTIAKTNARQGEIFDMGKNNLAALMSGGAYGAPQGQAVFQHIMGQMNPTAMSGPATPNYQQFGIGTGKPVGMNPYLTGGSMEGQNPFPQPPRPMYPVGGGQPPMQTMPMQQQPPMQTMPMQTMQKQLTPEELARMQGRAF